MISPKLASTATVPNMASPRKATSAQPAGPTDQEVPQVDMLQPVSVQDVPMKSPGGPLSAVDSTGSQSILQTQEEESPRVRCPCGVSEDDGLMVLCDICRYWQHGNCFLILSEVEAPAHHICEQCGIPQDPTRQCTDPSLLTATELTRQTICLHRRALVACKDLSRIHPAGMARRLGISVEVAKGIMVKLEKDGILKHGKGKSGVKVINKTQLLHTAIPKYLMHNDQQYQDKTDEVLEEEPEAAESEQTVKLAEHTPETRSTAGSQLQDSKVTPDQNMEDLIHRTKKIQMSQMTAEGVVAVQGKGKKRAVSVRNENAEFEICNSQDQGKQQSCKRMKVSTVDGIMV